MFLQGQMISVCVFGCKPDKLAQKGLTANDVVSALQEQNLQVAAGTIGAPPQQNVQAFEYSVLTNSRLSTPAAI